MPWIPESGTLDGFKVDVCNLRCIAVGVGAQGVAFDGTPVAAPVVAEVGRDFVGVVYCFCGAHCTTSGPVLEWGEGGFSAVVWGDSVFRNLGDSGVVVEGALAWELQANCPVEESWGFGSDDVVQRIQVRYAWWRQCYPLVFVEVDVGGDDAHDVCFFWELVKWVAEVAPGWLGADVVHHGFAEVFNVAVIAKATVFEHDGLSGLVDAVDVVVFDATCCRYHDDGCFFGGFWDFVPVGGDVCWVLGASGPGADDWNLGVVQVEWQAGVGAVDAFGASDTAGVAGGLSG